MAVHPSLSQLHPLLVASLRDGMVDYDTLSPHHARLPVPFRDRAHVLDAEVTYGRETMTYQLAREPDLYI